MLGAAGKHTSELHRRGAFKELVLKHEQKFAMVDVGKLANPGSSAQHFERPKLKTSKFGVWRGVFIMKVATEKPNDALNPFYSLD